MSPQPVSTSSMCRLCETKPTSPDSHIIPRHVSRAIKKHAPTAIRKFRYTGTPKPVQDTVNLPFLCNDCEQRFGKLEDKLARNVVIPLVKVLPEVQLDPLSRLAITSVTWRALRYLIEFNKNEFLFHIATAESAEVALRDYLIDPDKSPPREQYVFTCDEIENTSNTITDDGLQFSIGMDPIIFYEETLFDWVPSRPFVFG